MGTSGKQTVQSKKALLEMLQSSLGVVTAACQKANICRTTFYEWYKADIHFKAQVDDIKEEALDYAETALLKKIKEGNIAAIIFYLKTQGKARGYIERQEIVPVGPVADIEQMTGDELMVYIKENIPGVIAEINLNDN